MVSTRNHPTELPEPAINTPSRSTRTTTSPSTANGTSKSTKSSTSTTTSSIARRAKSPPSRTPTSPASSTTLTRTTSRSTPKYTHAPSHLTLLWLAVSLPLVIWDTGYVLLRPHSMPGGALHWPLWTPYELYGEIDYVYGWPAWRARNGFTAAQASLNVVETVMYLLYAYWVAMYGVEAGAGSRGRGAPRVKSLGWLREARVVRGDVAAWAVVVLYSASLMTVSKTVLYAFNEIFSGFAGIGHNSWFRLIFLYILTNGMWVVVPSYIGYVAGAEILAGLGGTSSRKRQ